MHSITRALGVVLASSALLLTAGLTGAGATPSPSVRWEPCPDNAAAECGRFALPVDWAKPEGEKFDLAVVRRKAQDPARRVGVLFVNPGGPGGSATNMALAADRVFTQDVLDRFDIIGPDPRGVARSKPGVCSRELMARPPSLYPASQAEFDALVAYNRQLRTDCRQRSGALWDHVNTKNVNRDMDALRVALGERKISYFGISYGTLIGQQYAEDYGDKVRAMVLDSTMDHSLGAVGFAVTEAWAAEDSFREWVRWCDRTASCALHGKDVAKEWDRVLERADRGELTDPFDPTRRVTWQDISQRAVSAFYGPGWAPLAAYVKALADQTTLPPQPELLAEEPVTANPFTSVFCQDWQIRVSSFRELTQITQLEKRVAPHMRGSVIGHRGIASCIGLPDATNPQHPLRITTAPTVLMLNAEHDPATGYVWAVNAAFQAGGAVRLVTYDGWGHGVYKRSDCTHKVADDYLVNGTLPASGTRCAAVEPPATAERAPLTPAVPTWR